MCRVLHFAVAFSFMIVCSCDNPATVPQPRADGESASIEKPGDDNPPLTLASIRGDEPPVSVLAQVMSFADVEMPPAEFEPGHAEPIETSKLVVEPTDYGYVVTFPFGSPIPTPTVIGDRVYVSGGFTSESFHCLDLESGEPIWEMQLDDDGPSTGVPCDDLILLGTESCTVFALNQQTGALAWSAYLGDPLLSAPAAADGKMVTVYPAASQPPEAVMKLAESAASEPERPPADTQPSQEVNPDHDEAENPAPSAMRIADLLEPTHLAICMDARSGDVLWRKWIDSDCLTAPVIVGDDVFIASLAGTLYQLSMQDGSVRSARRMMATSAPLVIDDSIYITRRREATDGKVQEYLSFLRREDSNQYFAAAPVEAIYLQAAIQMKAGLQGAAVDFEQMNGFGGGGFGGGFGGNSGGSSAGGEGNMGGGGLFQIPDDLLGSPQEDQSTAASEEQTTADEATADEMSEEATNGEVLQASDGTIDYSVIGDLLGYTEVQAAENIGLGSASTIQGFAGSVTVADSSRLFNTMGDRLVCTSRQNGDVIWTSPIEGDLEKLGGHLASPPVIDGDRLFLATARGKILEIDRETGKSVEVKQFDTQFRFRPVVTPGAIVVTSQDGRLFCLRRSTE